MNVFLVKEHIRLLVYDFQKTKPDLRSDYWRCYLLRFHFREITKSALISNLCDLTILYIAGVQVGAVTKT